MSEEMKLRKDMERASLANSLLDNELFSEAFASLDEAYIRLWRDTPDPVARERIWNAVNVVADVKRHFETIVRNGRLAQAELEAMASKPA